MVVGVWKDAYILIVLGSAIAARTREGLILTGSQNILSGNLDPAVKVEITPVT